MYPTATLLVPLFLGLGFHNEYLRSNQASDAASRRLLEILDGYCIGDTSWRMRGYGSLTRRRDSLLSLYMLPWIRTIFQLVSFETHLSHLRSLSLRGRCKEIASQQLITSFGGGSSPLIGVVCARLMVSPPAIYFYALPVNVPHMALYVRPL